jgi:hypothetical protein
LYGCETASLTLREEHRLRVLQNRILKRIFVPKRDEVMGEWRKLQKIRSYVILTIKKILLGRSNKGG